MWEHGRGRRVVWQCTGDGSVGARPGDGGQFGPTAESTGGASLLKEAACDSPEVGPTLNTCG